MQDDSLSDIAARLEQVAAKLATGTMDRTANKAAHDVESVIEADLPGRRFSHWNAPPLAVHVRSQTLTAELTAEPFAVWSVLSYGRKPGPWGTTQGKGTADRALDKVNEHFPADVNDEVEKVLGQVY